MFKSLVESGAAADVTNEVVETPLVYGCNCTQCAGSADNGPQGWGQNLQYSATAATGAGSATLLSGSQWTGSDAAGQTVITYSFANASSVYASDSASYAATMGEFSSADKAATRALLDKISAVCNVSFVEVADGAGQQGTIRYAYSQAPNDMGFAGFAFFPSNAAIGGDVWIGKAQAASVWDFYRPSLILHETLHAIGLKHPFDGGARLDSTSDIIPNTVMSYSPMAGGGSGWLSKYPTEPMPIDVAALQALYGAASHNAGDTVYDLSAGEFQAFRAVWDSSGNDVLDASQVNGAVYLDLREGARSDIGVQVNASAYFGATMSSTVYTNTLALAGATHIENAIGSAFADMLVGNAAANLLAGGAGNDILNGGAGDDWLVGGQGNDTLDGGTGSDTAAFIGGIANFKVEKIGDALYVTDRLSGQGTDLLAGVEKLRFQDLSVDLTVQDAAAAVSAARLQAVVELYVGFFNRVPDAEGLGFWLAQMNEGMSTAQVADAFYSSALLYPALTGYNASMSNADFVGIIYKNVLGRSSVDAQGLSFWSQALADGSETRGSLLEAILGSAHTFKGDATYGFVADLLANKFEVGKTFAVDMGLTWNTPELSIQKGMQIAAAVTSTDMSAALSLIGVLPQDLTGF